MARHNFVDTRVCLDFDFLFYRKTLFNSKHVPASVCIACGDTKDPIRVLSKREKKVTTVLKQEMRRNNRAEYCLAKKRRSEKTNWVLIEEANCHLMRVNGMLS